MLEICIIDYLTEQKKQKEQEKKKFERMGLYSNPWATGDEYTREYWCLNCNVRWNGKNKDMIEYF